MLHQGEGRWVLWCPCGRGEPGPWKCQSLWEWITNPFSSRFPLSHMYGTSRWQIVYNCVGSVLTWQREWSMPFWTQRPREKLLNVLGNISQKDLIKSALLCMTRCLLLVSACWVDEKWRNVSGLTVTCSQTWLITSIAAWDMICSTGFLLIHFIGNGNTCVKIKEICFQSYNVYLYL